MLSRSTARFIGDAYQDVFSHSTTSHARYNTNSHVNYYVDDDRLYDFLYENDYDAWFCNYMRFAAKDRNVNEKRRIKEFVMKLHTGEAIYEVTKDWKLEQRQELGQRYLRDLAIDVIKWAGELPEGYRGDHGREIAQAVRRGLELDGYIYENGNLLFTESDVLDVAAEVGVLQSLYTNLNLDKKDVLLHHLELSEQNYIAGHWGDVISNSRDFLECVLMEVAAAYCSRVKQTRLGKSVYESPVAIRDYLENEKLLETKEKEALSKVYGLLSNIRSHPYIAENDQARLMRHLALTFSQFVMLRYQGFLNSLPKP